MVYLIFFILRFMKFPQLNAIPTLGDKKLYFASDFHLGTPSKEASFERELKIIRWLDEIKNDAHTIYLVGDIFDFWFEYRNAIPKGFARFKGKLAELVDSGINVVFFTGNHDMWMFDYFTEEFSIPIYREPHQLKVNGKNFLIGHGDGLGPGDNFYKVLKVFFNSKICQWLFARIHPNLGIGIANYWSKSSRIRNTKDRTESEFMGKKEHLWQYCESVQKVENHDFYIFGHRHLPLDLEVGTVSKYFNLGEWVNYSSYGVFDGNHFELKYFEKSE